ncbi:MULTISPECIES: DNA-binding response regulator [Bifidobacterium]|nr:MULTISPECIES: response regulator [Bifidobacterium]
MTEHESNGGNGRISLAAVDNDAMTLMALQAIAPKLLPGGTFIWTTDSPNTAVRRSLNPATRPDMLLMDMSLGRDSGAAVCRRIRARTPHMPVLAVTSFPLHIYAKAAAEAGAQGIASKSDMPALARAMRIVADGGTVPCDDPISFETAEQAHRRLATDLSQDLPLLTDKEVETLEMMSRGYTFERLAKEWGVGSSTIRTHAHRAEKKLGAATLAQAIAIWMSEERA